MNPCQKSEEDPGLGRIHAISRGERCEKSYGLTEARERDLPPLPDDVESAHDTTQASVQDVSYPKAFAVTLKSSTPLFTPSLATPSKHDLVFRTYRPRTSSLRPKLRLETDWDSHSADDVSIASRSSESIAPQKFSSLYTSAVSQHKLLYPAPYHEDLPCHPVSSIPDVSPAPSTKSPSANCSFLRLPKLPAIVRTAQTRRAVNPNSAVNSIVAKPFMRSDPENPLQGITITVQQQRIVSEPNSGFSSPSATSLVSAVSGSRRSL
ncbi:hypothetical protein B0H19DRAFT_125664 [Mycena capillaripes]|nr:hypothetical protein B0H19DRAFT_125664 [Mycena capillaripes]